MFPKVELSWAFELRHLHYVVAAGEAGSFRRGVCALVIQESAVSRRIRDLKDDVGAAIFIRHLGGVVLTYAGTNSSCTLARLLIKSYMRNLMP